MDRRIEKTLVKIRSGLLSLVQEKDIADISVAELSRAAGVDRKTFYLHYRTVEDALMELCDFTVSQATARFSGDLTSDIKSLYDYLAAAPEGLALLISGEKSSEFRTRFLHGLFTSEAFSRYYRGADHCLVEGFLYSIVYIYEECLHEGCGVDTEELASMAAELIEHGIVRGV